MKLLLTILVITILVHAQAADPPSFDAASIKVRTAPEPYHWDASPGMLHLHSMTLRQCILTAYHVQDFQVVGGPGWVDDSRYDIEAKAATPAKRDELLLMLRSLLTERFHLLLQRSSQPSDGYNLKLAKDGLKIKADPPGHPTGIEVHADGMTASGFPMEGLVGALSNILQVPVSDSTGLSGTYSFTLRWRGKGISGGDPNGASPIMTSAALPDALRDTVGMQLVRGKVEVPVLRIESAERPSGN